MAFSWRSIVPDRVEKYVPHTWEGLAVSPLTPLYAIGAGINELSGGKSTTWSPVAAVQGGVQGTTYSPSIQTLSGYQGPAPPSTGAPPGEWRLPVLNPSGAQQLGDGIQWTAQQVGEGAGGILAGLFKGLGPVLTVVAVAAGGLAIYSALK